jgi:hypothetical protein
MNKKLNRKFYSRVVENGIQGDVSYDARKPYTVAAIDVKLPGCSKLFHGVGFAKLNPTKREVLRDVDREADAAIDALVDWMEHYRYLLNTDQDGYIATVGLQLVSMRQEWAKTNAYEQDQWDAKKGAVIAKGKAIIDVVKQIQRDPKVQEAIRENWINEWDDKRGVPGF